MFTDGKFYTPSTRGRIEEVENGKITGYFGAGVLKFRWFEERFRDGSVWTVDLRPSSDAELFMSRTQHHELST